MLAAFCVLEASAALLRAIGRELCRLDLCVVRLGGPLEENLNGKKPLKNLKKLLQFLLGNLINFFWENKIKFSFKNSGKV